VHPSRRRFFFAILIVACLAVFAAVAILWQGSSDGTGGMEGGSAATGFLLPGGDLFLREMVPSSRPRKKSLFPRLPGRTQ